MARRSAVPGFIPDTINYREFCVRHFSGGFLEHTPGIGFYDEESASLYGPVVFSGEAE